MGLKIVNVTWSRVIYLNREIGNRILRSCTNSVVFFCLTLAINFALFVSTCFTVQEKSL